MGGWASTKTQSTVITPGLIPGVISIIKEFQIEFNKGNMTTPVRFIRPMGSATYFYQDIIENPKYIYGDIDYLVEFPLLHGEFSSKRERENRSIAFHKERLIKFILSGKCDRFLDVEETVRGNGAFLILRLAHDLFVQVDIVATTEDYIEWNIGRFKPQRGLKGFTIGGVYTALNELYNINVSDRGAIVRIKDGSLVSGKLRKDVEIVTVSTKYDRFWKDLVVWFNYFVNKKISFKTHSYMNEYPGVQYKNNIYLEDVLKGLHGFIYGLYVNDLLGTEVFPESTVYAMMANIRERYNKIMDERLNARQYAKSSTPESENTLRTIGVHARQGKEIFNKYFDTNFHK